MDGGGCNSAWQRCQSWVVTDPGAPSLYLRRVTIRDYAASPFNWRLDTDPNGDGGSVWGMANTWETSDIAFVITTGSASVQIPGPDNPSNDSQDGFNNYAWRPSATVLAAVGNFLAGYAAASQAERDATTILIVTP